MANLAKEVLLQKGVKIEGASIDALLEMPIDWVKMMNRRAEGIRYEHGYGMGHEYLISVTERYVTVTHFTVSNSYVHRTGFRKEYPVAQFLLEDFSNNTKSYRAFLHRKWKKAKMEELEKIGLTIDQSKKFLRSKVPYKWEIIEDLPGLLALGLHRSIYEKLASTSSHREFNLIVQRDVGQEEFLVGTFPRRTSHARLLGELTENREMVFGTEKEETLGGSFPEIFRNLV